MSINYMPANLYSLHVDGVLQTRMTNYDWIFQRGLAIAVYLKLDFKNSNVSNIVDMWTGSKNAYITKEPIQYPNPDKNYYSKY